MNLRDVDHRDYAEFTRKKERLGIKPFTYNIVNITFKKM